jgi:hypothetical protein
MLVYAVAVGCFLGLAVVLVLLLHRALVAEDARYGARCEPPAAPPASSAPPETPRAA